MDGWGDLVLRVSGPDSCNLSDHESSVSSSRTSRESVWSPSSSSSLTLSHSPALTVAISLADKGPRGRMMKKLINMTIGRNADAKRVFLLLNPSVVVATAYAPAPTSPAPPVPLPHAAKLNGP